MLIRFTTSNYLSFNEEIEFSMIPGKSRNHPHHVIKGRKRSSTGVLKAAVIYGANASGKSNLIKTIAFARDLIVNGVRPNKHIPRIHFKLDASCAGKPSRFEFEFKQGDRAYAYGFELDTKTIHSEWLYEITKTSQKKIFERQAAGTDETVVEFGKVQFRNKNEQKLLHLLKTRGNQLFLTQSIEAGARQFEDILAWFRKLIVIFPDSQMRGPAFTAAKGDTLRDSLVEFLKRFGTGISGIGMVPMDSSSDAAVLPDEVRSKLAESLGVGETRIFSAPDNRRYLVSMNEGNELEIFKLMTGHRVHESSEEVLLEVNDESDGTRRLMDLIPALNLLLERDTICIIDELDRSMHPKLSFKILELFLNSGEGRESQLIVTTHESSLLNLGLLRRDEIWFVAKDRGGASSVYSLEEFVPRYDKDVRKGYLLGRFGGIPVVEDISELGVG